MPSSRRRVVKKTDPEELVQDPYCLIYIPKGSALRKKIGGKIFYFCNKDCLLKYIEETKRKF
jgi:YHS domain-containing protein